MILLAHLSDTHLDTSEARAARVRAVLAQVAGLTRRPDAVLVTGDVTDHGLPEEYAQARDLLAADVPVLSCPGNHDVRASFRASYLVTDGKGTDQDDSPVNQVWSLPGLTVALCDSTIPGRPDGYLADETLDWLDAALAAAGAGVPAVVGFHHPPVPLQVPFIDGMRQGGAERLARVLDRHPQVVAVLCGHAHTPAATTFAGRPLLVAPGVLSTLRFPWEPDDAVVDEDLPPALAYHVIDDTGITTHFRAVPLAHPTS